MSNLNTANLSKKAAAAAAAAAAAQTEQVEPVEPVLSLLATLQAAAPSVATSAQLASAIATVQGHYSAIQNGIAAPTRGTSCIAVWCAFCAYCVANKTVPTLTQLAPQLSAVNATTQSVQFYKVKKYFGL